MVWNWPFAVSAGLLFAVIGLLLVTGQTIIFLLRLVAADRRGRRRPLASGSKTVGELEDAGAAAPDELPSRPATTRPRRPTATLRPRAPCDNSEPGRQRPADRSPEEDRTGARARDLLQRSPRP